MQALQQAGHIVGMTGDGINDAPAMRQLVGVAVNNATDIINQQPVWYSRILDSRTC
ncbi:MAG: hypothetical protein U0528_01385 [Anaerolineae bacterium]